MYNFFYSLVNLVIALFFVIVGIVAILIPWSNTIKHLLIQFINEDPVAISLFGLSLLAIGIFFLVYVLQNTKKRYYTIRTGNNIVSTDLNVIEDSLKIYWEKTYPGADVPCYVQLNENKIHITADLPRTPLEEQKFMLKKINNDLSELLANLLGYKDEFKISISFNNR